MHKLLRAARQSGGTTRQAGTDVSMTANGCRVAGPQRLSKLWVAAAGLLILTLLDVASGHLIESETMSTCPADGSGGETCQERAGVQDSGACAHCSGHGNCDPTQTFSPCMCEQGWEGRNCSVLQDCADVGGCVHGVCILGGNCSCDPGWHGNNCSIAECPKNCNGHGACDITSGNCNCDPGWEGRSCAIKQCLGNCTAGQGECNDGVCVCYDGWAGENCELYTCKHECFRDEGHGECDSENQRCICSPYWTGDDCSLALCPNDCSGHGACLDGGCMCDAGWSDAACASKLCMGDCSGHGTCAAGECECQTGWEGSECQWRTSCIPPCVHGSCVYGSVSGSKGNATCVCDLGWEGDSCEELAVARAAEMPCAANCTGHGS